MQQTAVQETAVRKTRQRQRLVYVRKIWQWATAVLLRQLLGLFYFSGFAMFPVRPSLLLLLPSFVPRWWNAVATTVLLQLLVGLPGGLFGYQSMLARWLTLRVATGQSRFAAAACGCSFNPRWYLSLGLEFSLRALSCI